MSLEVETLRRKSRSMSRFVGRLILPAELAVMAGILLAACNRTVQSPADTPTPVSEVVEAPTPVPVDSPDPSPSPTVSIYVVEKSGEGSESQLTRRDIPAHEDSAESAVNALNRMASDKNSPLPSGVKALSVKFGEDGTATANFNSALKDNFPSGDSKEALTLNAILATVGQFPGVKQVQITVDGEKVGLGGTQDTTEPLPIPSPVGVRVSRREGQP
jgi:hypothetical protein